MKNNKGITLIALIAYIILMLTIIAILTSMTRHFRRNVSFVYAGSYYEVELDKLEYEMLKQVKNRYNTVTKQSDTKITFNDGTNTTVYTYSAADKTIYANSKVRIATHIDECTFKILNVNGKKAVRINMILNGRRRISEFVLENRSA